MSTTPEQPEKVSRPDELDRLRAFAMRKASDPETARFRAEVRAHRESGTEPERLGRTELLARARAVRQD